MLLPLFKSINFLFLKITRTEASTFTPLPRAKDSAGFWLVFRGTLRRPRVTRDSYVNSKILLTLTKRLPRRLRKITRFAAQTLKSMVCLTLLLAGCSTVHTPTPRMILAFSI